MKAKLLRTHVAALMLLAPAASFIAMPGTAMAAKRVAPAPEIFTLSVNSDEGLRAGADLDFAVEGTPRSKVSVALARTNIVVGLRETSAGMYRGTYTVRSRDRIDPTATISARLTSGKRTATRSFTWPASFQQLAMGNAPAPVPVTAPRIDQFRMWPNRVEPGRELHYVIHGVPGGSATFDIPGIASGIAMRETQPGRYEGTYTVRQRDNPAAFETATATLRSGNQVATARMTNPNVARDNSPPSVTDLTPRPGETVSSAGNTVVAAQFEDAGGRGVDPSTVRIVLSGRDITRDSRITPREFSFRDDLPPGRYTAEVTARDFAGNAVNKTWNFEVGNRVIGYNGADAQPRIRVYER